MARLTIQVFPAPENGSRTYRISLVSDEDATPREHEQNHRRAVRSLLGDIDLDTESPRFRVEREAPRAEPPPPCPSDDDGYEVIDLG